MPIIHSHVEIVVVRTPQEGDSHHILQASIHARRAEHEQALCFVPISHC